MSKPSFRKHRSGRLVRTDLQYKPTRRGIIGKSQNIKDQFLAFGDSCSNDPNFNSLNMDPETTMRTWWRLFDKGEILEKLDALCPAHGYNMRTRKIPMLLKWVQLQKSSDDPEVKYRRRTMEHPPRWARSSRYMLPIACARPFMF